MSVISAIALACITYLLGLYAGTRAKQERLSNRNKRVKPSDYSRALEEVISKHNNIKDIHLTIITYDDATKN